MTPREAPSDQDMDAPEYLHAANTEPILGYRLLSPLGKGGFGEVWKCEAPGGLLKAVKFVHGGMHVLDDNAPADEELRAIQRVKTMRHPFILTMERVEIVGGELVIVMELADQSLADVLAAMHKSGKLGIPRDTLLAYLREAAEVLDLMNSRHGLQHLDIKPQNLFLVANHVKVGDFGLVSSFGGTGSKLEVGAITPLYASPEVFEGSISAHSDQYSLAIVYQELLTGSLPFVGKNSRQLMMQHLQGQPNLDPLTPTDRAIVGKALAKKPMDRFLSCSDFIQALVANQTDTVTATTEYLPARPARSTAETRQVPKAKTVQTRSVCVGPLRGSPDAGSPKLTVLDLVSRTQLSEVWNARADDGTPRTVKVLFGGPAPGHDAVKRLAALRHPGILPIDIIQHTPGRLVLAAPPGQQTLREVMLEEQAHGSPGIHRRDLLDWLAAAATTLDELRRDHGLVHLQINPKTLALDAEQLVVTDAGIAMYVWQPVNQPLAPLNTRYSAPELHARQISETTDQYSLALVYHEMLTGAFPVFLVNPGQPHTPRLDRLPEADRPIVARALHADPNQRWPSAAEFVRALDEVTVPQLSGTVPRSVAAAAAKAEAAGEVMRTHFGTSLAGDVIADRLEGFRQQWNAERRGGDPAHYVYRMQPPRESWNRWQGPIAPVVEIHVRIATEEITTPGGGVQKRTDVRMDLHPLHCTREQAGELLKGLGSLLVESMKTHLQVNPCGRAQERIVWHHPLQVCAILGGGALGPPVECQGKDISLNGIGFYLPGELATQAVMLHLPKTEQTPRMSIPARVVRSKGCGAGWLEVGAVLMPPDELPEGA